MNPVQMQEQERELALCELDDALRACEQMQLIQGGLRAYCMKVAQHQRDWLRSCRERVDEIERWRREGGELAL